MTQLSREKYNVWSVLLAVRLKLSRKLHLICCSWLQQTVLEQHEREIWFRIANCWNQTKGLSEHSSFVVNRQAQIQLELNQRFTAS